MKPLFPWRPPRQPQDQYLRWCLQKVLETPLQEEAKQVPHLVGVRRALRQAVRVVGLWKGVPILVEIQWA
ncbi:hypothetical protein HY630_03460 [Candidatus Uhrbacteria bacterium]|nr:hypothetical protein [Candidatus Uhrbacteria bacterium]